MSMRVTNSQIFTSEETKALVHFDWINDPKYERAKNLRTAWLRSREPPDTLPKDDLDTIINLYYEARKLLGGGI